MNAHIARGHDGRELAPGSEGEHTLLATTGTRRAPSVPEGKRVPALTAANAEAYLTRIGYRGSPKPDAQTLRALHLAHLRAVPFENLDVALQRRTVLDLDWLFDKVVHQGRGGVCCETNALFGALLSALGFEVQMLSAGVYDLLTGQGPDFEHMLLAVDLDRRWMADVGFGETFHEPLLLDEAGEQREGERVFCIRRDGDYRDLWMGSTREPWEKQYRFTLQPRSLHEYASMCHFRLSAPHSFFSRNLTCSRLTADGRVTIQNDRLIITTNGQRQEHPLQSDQELREKLREHFGIDLPDDQRLGFPSFRRGAQPARGIAGF